MLSAGTQEREFMETQSFLAVAADAAGGPLYAAARLLTESGGRVLLEGVVCLRRDGALLECSVVDASGDAFRCENEFAALVENARHALEGSTLYGLLNGVSCRWYVVTSCDEDADILWRAPKALW